jgi:T-complex protein 1 subunit gamma
MLKMLMDPMGGICLTNDGNAILREITVQHPAAKSLIEIARTQDEEVCLSFYSTDLLKLIVI